MDRIRFIEHKGTRVLLEDFSNIKDEAEFMRNLEIAREIIHSQPENSVLAVFDVSGTRYNSKIANAVKHFAESNTPYIKMSVVAGMSGMMDVILTAVRRFTRRPFKSCDTREEALDWLVENHA